MVIIMRARIVASVLLKQGSLILFFVALMIVSGCAQEQGEASEQTDQPAETETSSADQSDSDFKMQIVDVFTITGRGVVATGVVSSGTVSVGDELCLVKEDGERQTVSVAGLEQFRKLVETASAGDNLGVLFEDLELSALEVGATLTAKERCQ